ncbi:hypothetical protein KKE26_00595 [bacterium]|nr:hypothetical protein [bacterium]MBU1752815.1 hypothetical protein [bacterium]
MNIKFSSDFKNGVKKHSSINKNIQNKVDMIISDPIGLGEPLKGNFRGFYSAPVKKNFIIIFLYCYVCRKKGDNNIVLCNDCQDCLDDTIKFVAIGPHDKTYATKIKQ